MLSEKSIQQVRDLSITEVISRYVKLDKNGKACCPFHNEKSASFKVTEAKGIFKCFGCGVSGDHISFVMKHDRLVFIEAIIHIAGIIGLQLEYEEVPDKEKYEQQKAMKDRMKEVLQYVVEDYRANLFTLPDDHPVAAYLLARGITRELMIEWQLGWSTEQWQHLSPGIINKGWYEPAHQLGIVLRSKDDRNYDGYRSRIIIPITNKHGEYIGIGGRFFEIDTADKDKKFPKYINPPQNDVYDKSQVLFGLSRAIKAIEEESLAYLVEGYFDVISMHAAGLASTIATCGTALTTQQAQLLKRYTSHAVLMRDGDAAGQKATRRDLETLLRAGFKVEVITLPDGEDPDSYVRKLLAEGKAATDIPRRDGVMWELENLVADTGDDHFKLGKAKEAVLQLLLKIPNDIIRNNYFDAVLKKTKWKGTELKKQLNELIEASAQVVDDGDGMAINKLPKWMDREEFEVSGYCRVQNKTRTGYYTHNGDKSIEITNFTINPIFHVYAGVESRHLIQIDNGRKKAVLDVESKALVSIDLLQSHLVGEGNFIIHGSKPQMLRIASNLLEAFPKCMEVKFLGWQQAGFFAFADKIYVPGEGMRELDEWGVYKHGEGSYLVPAASAAYKELQKAGEDKYELYRVLTYREGEINFSQWAIQMQRVYKDKGAVAVAFTILTMFRDIVFEIDNNCPHLYGFGERSSGKSKWAESICAVFYHKRAAFNLNSSTDFAFFSYMQLFINCPSNLNEFDEKIIKPEWFQSIKGAFDGESRQRGKMGSPNHVQIMKIRSTLILIGQYICTTDDNSIVSRSIIEDFSEKDHSDEDKKEYDKLKRLEETGMSNLITEIVKYRSYFKEHYRTRFNETLGTWRRGFDGDGQNFNQRIMQNWCHLYTCWQLIADHMALPVSTETFEAYCMGKGLRWSKFIRSSDTLSEFWNTLNFLADLGVITEGWDYKIESVLNVRIRRNEKEEVTIEFPEITKVIYIRMNNVHKHYQQAFRTRTGKEGMTMENLKHYFGSRKYYLGSNKQKRFKRFVVTTENVPAPTMPGMTPVMRADTRKEEQEQMASSYVFLYDQLGLELERGIPGESDGTENPVSTGIQENDEPDSDPEKLPF